MAAVAYALYPILPGAIEPGDAAPQRIHPIPAAVVGAVYVLGVAGLAALALYAWRPRRTLGVVVILLVVAQATLVLRFGTWTQAKAASATWDEIARGQRDELGYTAPAGAGMENAELVTLRRQLGRLPVPRPLARLHWDAIHVASPSDALARLRARPRRVVVGRPDPPARAAPAGRVGSRRVSLLGSWPWRRSAACTARRYGEPPSRSQRCWWWAPSSTGDKACRAAPTSAPPPSGRALHGDSAQGGLALAPRPSAR